MMIQRKAVGICGDYFGLESFGGVWNPPADEASTYVTSWAVGLNFIRYSAPRSMNNAISLRSLTLNLPNRFRAF